MKLYYKPGACSLASHIALLEVEAEFELIEVDTDLGQTKSGKDYKKINPKGYVPALELKTGDVLTEGASILQYIADQHPEKELAPQTGSVSRARLHEHLNYTASELHKAFGPFFSNAATDEDKIKAGENVARKFDYLETLLSDGRNYLLGNVFSVADAYMFVVINWSNFVGIVLHKWPNIDRYAARIASRKTAQTAMKAEGLVYG